MSLVVKQNGYSVDRRSSEYLGQLLNDKKQLQALPNVFMHVDKILDEEISRVRSGLLHWNEIKKENTHLPEPSGQVVTLSEKLFVPVNQHPEFNFVGRILGPRGMTAKQLELETGCKIMVRGKGSMRDKLKEEQNRGKTNWEHLNEELHVLITVEDTVNRAEVKLRNAVEEVKKLLVPTAEGEDELKKMQLMELAIMNGTFRDAIPAQPLPGTTITVVNTPQGPRMIATPSMNMPNMLQSPPMMHPTASMPGGAPIILTPRLPQYTAVTSLASQATAGIFSGLGSAGLMSAADGACTTPQGYMYSYDPFLQRMFEYSTTMEQSAAGAIPKMRRTMTYREHPYTRGPLV